jgi:copper transport protein
MCTRWLARAFRPVTWLLLAVALLAATAGPAAVSAHALLRSSDPAAGATLGAAPTSVLLTFGETPDPKLTSVQVLDRDGANHAESPLEAVSDPADSIRVPLGGLPDGVYTVTWRTVSAVDGHVSVGTFAFGIGIAPPSGEPQQSGGDSASGSPAAIGSRWLLYLGLIGLIGAAFVAVAVARKPVPELLLMAAAGWVLAFLGTVAVLAVQWLEVGAPLEELASSSIGGAVLLRATTLFLVAVALAGLAVAPALQGRRGWMLVGATAAIGLGADVALGHAAAGEGWLPQIASQWLHGLAAGAWMGGLAALLLILRGTPADERIATARRFSTWAGIALALVIATGVVRAVAEIGTLDALIGTDFGRVVVGKSVLLLGLASLGAFNRWVSLRYVRRFAGGFRRVGSAELVLAALVFGLSAWLVNLTPPTSRTANQAPPPQPIVAVGHDFGTSVRARLVATPGAAGANTFDLALTDYDSGEPIDAASTSLRFQLLSQAGVAPSTVALAPAGPGKFSANGTDLSIDGIWQVTATVTPATGVAVEVPLLAATTIPTQPVQTSVSPGLPTIYLVQLGAAGTAQVYLDPGDPGQNDLHVTFFDPTGGELATESATIAVFPSSGDASLPAPRRLGPGHFVATVEVAAGQLGVDVVSPLPGESAAHLRVHVIIEVQQ